MKLMHPFHMVTISPWPIIMSFNLMSLLISGINLFHNFNYMFLLYMFILMNLSMTQWFLDIILESSFQGFHTNMVLNGIKFSMILFITCEVLFFFSFFWSYLHMFLSPNIDYGVMWPPLNILSFNPYWVPLLNTAILLSSGVTFTLSHYYLIKGMLKNSIKFMIYTIILGVIFTLFQLMEYKEAMFCMADSIYGSLFFMMTGFHGLHVLIGTIFLIINLMLMNNLDYSFSHHFCFEAAAWYWHFVDVVWLFLFILVYYWPYWLNLKIN